MSTEIKLRSLLNKSAPDRERFLPQIGDGLPEIEHCAINNIAMEGRKIANQNSENELFQQTGDELDELMSQIIDCQVEILKFERESQNDVENLVHRELENHDTHFNNWITEMEVMFMIFVQEADDIVHHIMRDQLSLAESIEYMLEEASTGLYPSLHLDNSQLENDVINNLTISDGLVALTVRTQQRELDAMTSSHDAIFDDIVAIELACEKKEFEICRRGFLENMVTAAVRCVVQHKADQNVESVGRSEQIAIGKTHAVQPEINKTDAVQAVNSKSDQVQLKIIKKIIKPANSKFGFIKPKKSVMARVRSAVAGLKRRLFSCVEPQDVAV